MMVLYVEAMQLASARIETNASAFRYAMLAPLALPKGTGRTGASTVVDDGRCRVDS